jgi:hypothetical protein
MRTTLKETFIQHCGSGSAWIRIIFEILIGIRIKVKKPNRYPHRNENSDPEPICIEVKSLIKIRMNMMRLRTTAEKF